MLHRARRTLTTLYCYAMGLVCLAVLSSWRTVYANTERHIARLLWRGENEAELGCQEERQALGYTVKHAEQDKQRWGQVLRHDIGPQLPTFDAIDTFGTTVSQIAKAVIQNKVPPLFTVVTDPVGAGLIRDLLASGENISGTTSDVPLAMPRRLCESSIRRPASCST